MTNIDYSFLQYFSFTYCKIRQKMLYFNTDKGMLLKYPIFLTFSIPFLIRLKISLVFIMKSIQPLSKKD